MFYKCFFELSGLNFILRPAFILTSYRHLNTIIVSTVFNFYVVPAYSQVMCHSILDHILSKNIFLRMSQLKMSKCTHHVLRQIDTVLPIATIWYCLLMAHGIN